jgi:hypothetical protein
MSKVLVFPMVYEISDVPDLHNRANGDALFGEIDYGALKINIDASISDEMYPVIVWHEIFHAISKHSGLGLQENQVQGLAYQIVSVLEQNKELRQPDTMRAELSE